MSAVRTVSIPPPARGPAVPVAPAPAATATAKPVATPKAALRRPSRAPVYLAAVALFAGFSAFLSTRMLAGEDPALGLTVHPVAAVVPATPTQRKVIVTRRIRIDGLTPRQIRRRGVDRIVIVHRRAPAHSTRTVASAGYGGGATPALASAGGGVTATVSPRRRSGASGGGGNSSPAAGDPTTPSSAPSSTTPAPAPTPQATAPAAQTPAPAPAPAPAPVATTTS